MSTGRHWHAHAVALQRGIVSYMHMYMHMYMCMYMHNVHMYMHMYMHMYISPVSSAN